MCLVLGPSDVARIDNALVDNRSILTTKNILSLRKIEEKMVAIGGQAFISLNKEGQLSLTNPRDACETFARFM